MTLSRVIMVLSLAVLAFVLYNTVNETEEGLSNTVSSQPLELNSNNDSNEHFLKDLKVKKEEATPTKKSSEASKTSAASLAEKLVKKIAGNDDMVAKKEKLEKFESRNLDEGFNYENFEPNPLTNEGGAPIAEVNDQITDAEDDEADLQIDGTDLLAAPLVDRFHSLNSIANVNRNSSQDLRGDIEITYNDKYTPFYASHIYGEPLHANKLH